MVQAILAPDLRVSPSILHSHRTYVWHGGKPQVPEEEGATIRELYKKKHPNAFWIDFGDFSLMRMDTINAIRFVGGFAMAGDVKPEGEKGLAADRK